jgi:hypothetical protein
MACRGRESCIMALVSELTEALEAEKMEMGRLSATEDGRVGALKEEGRMRSAGGAGRNVWRVKKNGERGR